MTTRLRAGDRVRVKYGPNYWDDDENMEAWDDGDDDAIDPDHFPGFNSEMEDMVGRTYTVMAIHEYHPWAKLEYDDGHGYITTFWFHYDWLGIEQHIELNEVDNASPYKSVIIKIKRMESKRKGAGYVF